jgi:hypothetical protein
MTHLANLSLHDYYINVNRSNTLVFYKGAFDEKVIAEISQKIKKLLNVNPYLSKKIFSVFIELAQNISFYSAERNIITKNQSSGVGLIMLNEHADYYTVKTANFVTTRDTLRLAAKCETINSLSREDLRAFKRRLRNQPSSHRDSGNIGLIQVALLGTGNLRIELTNINEHLSFFTLELDVSKQVLSEDENT